MIFQTANLKVFRHLFKSRKEAKTPHAGFLINEMCFSLFQYEHANNFPVSTPDLSCAKSFHTWELLALNWDFFQKIN